MYKPLKSLFALVSSKKYPQYIWSCDIFSIIKSLGLDQKINNIYDAPGGAGFISYNLSKRIDKNFHVYDIDSSKIEFGIKYYKSTKLKFLEINIFDAVFEKKSLLLLINSLYLIDRFEKILAKNRDNLDYIIGVFPYTDTRNYVHFVKNIDSTLNTNEMNKSQTISYFKNNDYELVHQKDTTYFNYLLHVDNKVLVYFYLFIFSFMDKYLRLPGRLYWIGVFKKSDVIEI